MCIVSVKGKTVRIDGCQIGSTYSSHETAIHQGKKIHEKHYPQAKFEIVEEIADIVTKIIKKPRNKLAS